LTFTLKVVVSSCEVISGAFWAGAGTVAEAAVGGGVACEKAEKVRRIMATRSDAVRLAPLIECRCARARIVPSLAAIMAHDLQHNLLRIKFRSLLRQCSQEQRQRCPNLVRVAIRAKEVKGGFTTDAEEPLQFGLEHFPEQDSAEFYFFTAPGAVPRTVLLRAAHVAPDGRAALRDDSA